MKILMQLWSGHMIYQLLLEKRVNLKVKVFGNFEKISDSANTKDSIRNAHHRPSKTELEQRINEVINL